MPLNQTPNNSVDKNNKKVDEFNLEEIDAVEKSKKATSELMDQLQKKQRKEIENQVDQEREELKDRFNELLNQEKKEKNGVINFFRGLKDKLKQDIKKPIEKNIVNQETLEEKKESEESIEKSKTTKSDDEPITNYVLDERAKKDTFNIKTENPDSNNQDFQRQRNFINKNVGNLLNDPEFLEKFK